MKSSPGTTSDSLLIRLKQRDDEAWKCFDRFYLPLVEHWCVRCDLQFNDREDVKQLVAVKVHQSIDDFKRQRTGSFRAWLRSITQSQMSELYRSRGKVKFEKLMESFSEPTARETEEDDLILYREAVRCMEERFSENSIRCFIRIAIRQQSAKEVAEELGMTPGAVLKAKFSVLKRLRIEFGDFLEGQDSDDDI